MIVEKWIYPTLHTSRLLLRKIDMSDTLHIYEYASDNELTTYTATNRYMIRKYF